jgi:hypothetical protein
VLHNLRCCVYSVLPELRHPCVHSDLGEIEDRSYAVGRVHDDYQLFVARPP